MKALLKRLLLGDASGLDFAPIGLRPPQEALRLTLTGLGEARDVTQNLVVAGLRPLTVALCLPTTLPPEGILRSQPRLTVNETALPGRRMGAVRLVPRAVLPLSEQHLCLFEISRHENDCLPLPRLRLLYRYDQWLQKRAKPNPYNFQMSVADLRRFHVLYICPRPVVLVTVLHQDAGNLFPMDLIGPTDSPYFLMALRNTSPAVRLMQASGRMALSSVALEEKEIAYELGKHHKKPCIDWETLPFATRPSPTFGLPVPVSALHVREVCVEETYLVGSHTLFVTKIVRDSPVADGLQLHHVSGLYQRYTMRQGRPLGMTA